MMVCECENMPKGWKCPECTKEMLLEMINNKEME